MIMKKYEVKITETLERTVTVKAFNKNEAVKRAKIKYDVSEIVLDADDYTGTEYKVMEGEANNGVYNRTEEIA